MSEPKIENIYQLDGKVPLWKAVPFGLQHVLAMFVANLAPIIIIAGAAGLSRESVAMLLQNAMFVAGIATLIQLYPLGRVGARLPIVMGVSFTFVGILCYVSASYGYGAAVGAVLVGVAFYDLIGRAISLGYSFIHARENMAMVAVAGVFIVLGYLGCLVIGLPCGAKFVKELRHAGIIREV